MNNLSCVWDSTWQWWHGQWSSTSILSAAGSTLVHSMSQWSRVMRGVSTMVRVVSDPTKGDTAVVGW